MSAAHLLYIPLCILVGLIAGYVLGQKATLARVASAAAKQKE